MGRLLIAVLFVGLFLAATVVYPILKSENFRFTASKLVALVVVSWLAIAKGSIAYGFIALWPLSFIVFPEYWGKFTGFFRGQYIDETSPPILVSFMGWLFLVGLIVFFANT